MDTTIWIIQSLMAVLFVLHGIAMFNPPAAVQESVVKKMGYSLPFLKIIGTLEVLGGLGLILPSWTRIMPILSPLAATGLVIIMIGAAASHARQGEGKQTVATAVVTLLVTFVAIGRFWLAPI
jgi:uncharacterized membrane protein YphA (DoxX/SURF4 family)